MIILKKLNLKKDITKTYQKWMNDLEIHKFTEQKYKKHSIKDIKAIVKEKNHSKYEFLYGIFIVTKKSTTHIGNIKLGSINYEHKTGEISYFIGEKKLWGKGLMTEAIRKITNIAKRKGLKKIKASFVSINKGSEKVLKKNGFKIEGKFKSEIVYKNKRYDKYLYGKII